MIVIVCVDNNGGMLFNMRRQSQDRVVRQQILRHVGKAKLWLNTYSCGQFTDWQPQQLEIDEKFLQHAGADDYCFVENIDLLPYEQQIKKVILYKWNRDYPADLFFNLPLRKPQWRLLSQHDFAGYSHARITEEVYGR